MRLLYLLLLVGLCLVACQPEATILTAEAHPAQPPGTVGVLYHGDQEYRIRCDWWNADFTCREIRLISTGGLVTPAENDLIIWNNTAE